MDFLSSGPGNRQNTQHTQPVGRTNVNLWDRLDDVAEHHDVLRHPFYLRWTEGTLTRNELARYAGQYRHAVVALADAAAAAARSPKAGSDAPTLARHAAEERDHVALWDEFAVAVGGRVDAPPTDETRRCASVWAGDEERPLLHTLTAMYAIESAQPAISATKRTGLSRHYGISEAAYFSVHEERDVEHAAEARELIDRRLGGAAQDELVASARQALEANWSLLDGVERLTG
jgi:pyrroloquinoline-quinone synthase